ncbi:hypothetical protein DJ70_08705 [Halorubrum halodurans]|uniref:DUF8080 domain-containing protein n=1 Tax=Halorubrum halodurans TaxID=1383851 RepID=A0A256IJ69_9EURY|nr:hypothetical protein DJ70_08705 [Halorubrum halodurans]
MDFSWTVEPEGSVRFVACRVHNATAVPQRVRVRSRIDGPALPPRRSGVPEAGWDAGGVTLRLEPDERRGVGFAVVVPPTEQIADPPVEIADAGPIAAVDSPPRTAEAAVRSLGDHRPPRDAVVDAGRTGPVVDACAGDGSAAGTTPPGTDDAGPADGADAEAVDENDPATPTADTDPEPDDGGNGEADPRVSGAVGGNVAAVSTERGGPDDPFAGAERRMERAERRIERAERLTGADLATATDAVDRLGGVAAVGTLDERVADDAAALRRLSERAAALSARAEETDVPTEALERLA